jgi:RNA polymerase sigma-70 factor (ECF subfamily)
MMASRTLGHSLTMAALAPDSLDFLAGREALRIEDPSLAAAPPPPSFRAIYTEHVDLVWRNLRGLGVPESNVEDAVQDVFIVIHRRRDDFEARSSFRTWLLGIVLHVARNYRRTERRKGGCAPLDSAPEIADGGPGPHEEAATAQALRKLAELLGELDDDKREVFVLAELEQMSAPEIARALGINVNTVYSRLRAARRTFEEAAARKNGSLR